MKTKITKDFSTLEKQLGVEFRNKDILIQAFCHRSYINENPNFYLGNNERLEFLGDAVLELVITDYLYRKYNEREGIMTNWRAAVVNTQSLAKKADELGFNNFLLLSKGEEKDLGKGRQYILANTFEAFLGALYIDQGFEKAKEFIGKNLFPEMDKIIKEGSWRDAKSIFQEVAQEKVKETPVYKILKEWGPDHAKNFVSGVFIGDNLIAEGQGSSKQEAEENAAKKALKTDKWQKSLPN